MNRIGMNRRRFLSRVLPAAGAFGLSGCDAMSESPWFRDLLSSSEELTFRVQRFFLSPDSLAREFTEADISPDFRANGTTSPNVPEYRELAANEFADWRLDVGGLVERPARLSLADLRAMPARTQITRHDCVEGWSSIGKWKGVQLALRKPLEVVRLPLNDGGQERPDQRPIRWRLATEVEQAGG